MRFVLALLIAFPAFAATIHNDDSCDIGNYPAATLLLPHFRVETARHDADTLFSVVNVSDQPRLARVTIWTDWGYPVLSFPIYLTGYDAQSISLYDVIVNGVLAPPVGTSISTPPGKFSASNEANPHLDLSNCANIPANIPESVRRAAQSALVSGVYEGCGIVGSPAATHLTAFMAEGYATIDVVGGCSSRLPLDHNYFERDLLFDNVLTGEVIILNPATKSAKSSSLVHVRAVREGGFAGIVEPAPFKRTFYDRLTADGVRGVDRRQPLPSTFAARWVQGSTAGINTDFTIWREGIIEAPLTCVNVVKNSAIGIGTIVRFDEHENPVIFSQGQITVGPVYPPTLPAASTTSTASSSYPLLQSPAGDFAGWMYLNLNTDTSQPEQNWVTYSMAPTALSFGQTQSIATALGNGCSPVVAATPYTKAPALPIGPSPNINP
jgi:hypothetical protein